MTIEDAELAGHRAAIDAAVDDENRIAALNRYSTALTRAERWSEAADVCSAACELDAAKRGGLAHPVLLLNLGHTLTRAGRAKDALEPLRVSAYVGEKLDDPVLEAQANELLGHAHRACGDELEAARVWTRRLHLSVKVRDAEQLLSALLDIAEALGAGGEPQRALERFEEAVRLCRDCDPPLDERIALGNVCVFLHRLKRPAEALVRCDEFIELVHRRGGTPSMLATGHNIAARALEDLNRPAEALSRARQALEVATRGGAGAEGLVARNTVARRLQDLRRSEEALAVCEETLGHPALSAVPEEEVSAHNTAAWALHDLNRGADALAHADAALEQARRIGDVGGEAAALVMSGRIKLVAERLEDACVDLEAAVTMLRELGHRIGEAEALEYIAVARHALDQPEPAKAAISAALDATNASGDRVRELCVLHVKARVLESDGQLDEAIELLQTTLAAWGEDGDPIKVLWLHADLSAALGRAGRPVEALSHAEAGIVRAREFAPVAARLVAEAGEHLLALGRLDAAKERFRVALDLASSMDDADARFKAIRGLARILTVSGGAGEALRQLEALLDDTSTPSHRRLLAGDIAIALLGLGYRAEAHQMMLEALAAAYAAEDSSSIGSLLASIGGMLAEWSGFEDAALGYLRDALTSAREAGDQRLEATVFVNLSLALFRLGHSEEALRAADTAVRLLEPDRDDAGLAAVQVTRGVILRELGRARDAASALDIAGAAAIAAGDRVREVTVLHHRARLLDDAGRSEQALELRDQALALTEDWRSRLTDSDTRVSHGTTQSELYAGRVVSLLKLGREIDAFEALQAAKSRVLSEELDGGVSQSQPDDGLRERRQLEAQLAEAKLAHRAFINEHAPNSPESRRRNASLLAAINAAGRALRRVSAPARDTGTVSFALAELRTLLAEDTACLIEYLVSDQGIWAFVVTADGVGVVPIQADTSTLAALVEELRLALEHHLPAVPHAARLHRLLLPPQLMALTGGTDRLVVCPDGILHHLPFALLLAEESGEPLPREAPTGDLPGALRGIAGSDHSAAWGGLPYLVKTHVLSLAPSAQVFCQLRTRERERNLPRRSLLGIAWSATGSPNEIPHAERELIEVSSLCGDKDALLLVDEQATLDRVHAALPRHGELAFDIVHIAAHASADAGVESSGVWLYAGTGCESALWRQTDVARVAVPCGLLTLSCCETGIGRVSPGEGNLSLARAFHVAGATKVCASLWAVDDAATRALMNRMYAGIELGRVAHSLQRAQVELIDAARPPWEWAAFVVSGD